jgi:hypothetical protein
MRALEDAWSHALPGHEAAERDHVLRELHRLLNRERLPLRLESVRQLTDRYPMRC